MNAVTYLIIFVVVGIIFALIIKQAQRAEKNMDSNNFVIRQSKIIMWLGIVCIIFFGACLVLMSLFPNDTAVLWVYLVFIMFIIFGALLALFSIYWEIRVTGNEIRFSSIFSRGKTFTFADIHRVKLKNPTSPYQYIIIYSRTKRLLRVESTSIGYNILVDRLKQEQITFK